MAVEEREGHHAEDREHGLFPESVPCPGPLRLARSDDKEAAIMALPVTPQVAMTDADTSMTPHQFNRTNGRMKQRICGLCKTPLHRGAPVCTGCQGAVVHGATLKEMEIAFTRGAATGAVVVGTVWTAAWGVSAHALVATAMGAVMSAMAFVLAERRSHAGHVRTYRRRGGGTL